MPSLDPRLGAQPGRRVVIGIDPGLASLGYGIIALDGGRLSHIAHGCITTSSDQESGERLDHIYTQIRSIIHLYKPGLGGVEDLYFFRNVSSALPVAEARGIIKLAFRHAGVPLAEFSPNAIKKSVAGTARADKEQVQEMVRILLGLAEAPKPDHAADALAAAICRIHSIGPAGR
ncbi:MAG: Holliday junction resolvase RuvC [Spirochaetes bacterium]|nr:MAG: Holliday junction resolvase RuvC [Spirochaetota bacterium]